MPNPIASSVNVREFRENLADYLRRAEQGAEFVVTARGRELARIVPPATRKPRVFGIMKGQIKMAADFDELPADILDAMEGRDG